MLAGPMFEPSESKEWKSSFRKEGAHYNIFSAAPTMEMDAIRQMFPEGKADPLNFILFSTSGIHGTYTTIEEVEASMAVAPLDPYDITFLIVHPRLVCLRYGNVKPANQDDIDFLKGLRQSSWDVVRKIGLE